MNANFAAQHRQKLLTNYSLSAWAVAAFLTVSPLLSVGHAQTNYYVDGGWGSNAWDGLTAIYTNGHGPKLSISNTISAANSGDSIVVAAGFYQEFNWNPGNKILTIIPTGRVVVYDQNPATTDSDGDGIPDQWEARYGLDGLDPSDAGQSSSIAWANGTNNLAAYELSLVPPEITATVTPTPNANGWNNTNSVTVHFNATSAGSGVAWVTPDVTLTNEGADQEIDGIAIDYAGNISPASAFVSIDKALPTVTGSPADGDVINGNPPFVIEYADSPSGVDSDSLQVTLDGTNVSANFQTFGTGALWTPTNGLAAGTHTWLINITDLAGNATAASATFRIASDTNAPALSDFSLIADSGANAQGEISMPDTAEMWVEGTVNGSNTQISASVNFSEALAVYVRNNQFGRLVPLDQGTNIVVFTASDGSSNTISYAFRVIRSTRYRATISSPEFGAYAYGLTQTITGYVSSKIDEGTGEETTVTSVEVNGVSATLGSVDNSGNRSFSVEVPTRTDGGFTSLTMSIGSTNTVVKPTLAYMEGYRIIDKVETSVTDAGGYAVLLLRDGCPPNDWRVLGDQIFVRSNTVSAVAHAFTNVQERDYLVVTGGTNCETTVPEVNQAYLENSFDLSVLGVSTNTGGVDASTLEAGLQVSTSKTIAHLVYDGNDDGVPEYEDVKIAPSWYDGRVRFYAPAHYEPGTPVIFTLSNLVYGVVSGSTVDLSQVSLDIHGAIMDSTTPLWYSNEIHQASWRVIFPQTGTNRVYEIDKGSFHWPPANEVITNHPFAGETIVAVSSLQWLSFSGFHNAAARFGCSMLRVGIGSSRTRECNLTVQGSGNVTFRATTVAGGTGQVGLSELETYTGGMDRQFKLTIQGTQKSSINNDVKVECLVDNVPLDTLFVTVIIPCTIKETAGPTVIQNKIVNDPDNTGLCLRKTFLGHIIQIQVNDQFGGNLDEVYYGAPITEELGGKPSGTKVIGNLDDTGKLKDPLGWEFQVGDAVGCTSSEAGAWLAATPVLTIYTYLGITGDLVNYPLSHTQKITVDGYQTSPAYHRALEIKNYSPLELKNFSIFPYTPLTPCIP